MKKFLFLIVILCLISVSAMSDGTDIPLTQNQKNFINVVTSESRYEKAAWVNTYLLEVTLNSASSGVFDVNSAKLAAVLIATKGVLYTEKDICIKIIDPEYGELAYHCMGEQSES